MKNVDEHADWNANTGFRDSIERAERAGMPYSEDEKRQIKQQDLEEAKLVKKFHKDFRARRFPRFEEDPNVFEGLMIYSKEPRDEGEGEG